MTPTNKIRFVHGNHDLSGPQFTIAYHRDAVQLMFAFTNLYHKDEYVRAEGRKVSEARLNSAFDQDFLFDDTKSLVYNGVVVGFLSEKQKIGGLFIQAFRDDLSSIVADHIGDSLTLMDLKHSYIGQKLYQFVYEYNAAQTY